MKRKKYKKRSRTRGRPNFEAFGRFDRQDGHLELERVLVTFSQIHTYFQASMTSTTYSPKKKVSTLAKKNPKIDQYFFSSEMFFFQLAPGLISKAIFYYLWQGIYFFHSFCLVLLPKLKYTFLLKPQWPTIFSLKTFQLQEKSSS